MAEAPWWYKILPHPTQESKLLCCRCLIGIEEVDLVKSPVGTRFHSSRSLGKSRRLLVQEGIERREKETAKVAIHGYRALLKCSLLQPSAIMLL